MPSKQIAVYPETELRVHLTSKKITEQIFDLKTMKEYVGGTGIGARILYDEVKPGVEWSDPQNRPIFLTGLWRYRAAGSGTFSVVTKGCLTNGGNATQANGFFGAYLRFNGFLGIVKFGDS